MINFLIGEGIVTLLVFDIALTIYIVKELTKED